MKFVIEVEDFYLEDGELEKELKSYIVGEVVRQISEKIKDQVNTQVTILAEAEVKKSLIANISSLTEVICRTQKIKHSRYGSSKDELISIEDYIKAKFSDTGGWSSPNDFIEKTGKQYADEFKKRYDVAFATTIVNNMNRNNLLREDVAKLLLVEGEKK